MEYTAIWQNEIQMSPVKENDADIVATAKKTDLQLVELVLSGDEIAFENLFDRYKRFVGSIASRYFHQPDQIEEIIQISFAQAFFQLRYFRGIQDFSFPSWLGKITTNICLDTLKKHQRKPENLLCELSESEIEILLRDMARNGQSAESSLIERDLAEKLLSQLPVDDRALLQMLNVEEMSVGEVAEITGWSNSKIKIRAFRARHALRKVLKRFL